MQVAYLLGVLNSRVDELEALVITLHLTIEDSQIVGQHGLALEVARLDGQIHSLLIEIECRVVHTQVAVIDARVGAGDAIALVIAMGLDERQSLANVSQRLAHLALCPIFGGILGIVFPLDGVRHDLIDCHALVEHGQCRIDVVGHEIAPGNVQAGLGHAPLVVLALGKVVGFLQQCDAGIQIYFVQHLLGMGDAVEHLLVYAVVIAAATSEVDKGHCNRCGHDHLGECCVIVCHIIQKLY